MAYGGNSGGSCNGGDSLMNVEVGGSLASADQVALPVRAGHTGDIITSEYAGRYAESTRRGEVFSGGNQTAVTFTVGLATTYTGFVLINPVGSGVYAELIYAQATLSVAATVPGPIGLIGGGSSAGVTAFTAIATTLWGSTKLDNNAGVNSSKCALAAAGITLVGTPRYLAWLGIVGTVATTSLGMAQGIQTEWAGSLIVGPGGYVAFGSNVAEATALCSFTWRESPFFAVG